MSTYSRISALLAKAERTTNEHERDAFNAKAEELMLRYGLEQAELQAAGEVKEEDIVNVVKVYTGDYSVVSGIFANTVAVALGNLTVIQGNENRAKVVYLIGHESDVNAAGLIIDSLWLQGMQAAKRWSKSAAERQYMTGWQAYKARRQFLTSFASGASERIRQEREIREADASTGAALVLVGKQKKVDAWADAEFNPKKSRGYLSGSSFGHAEGREAGRQADVGTSRFEGGRKELA